MIWLSLLILTVKLFRFGPRCRHNLYWSCNISLPLQVNKDFGAIFSTLLPGATAKLAPPQGCGVLEGLEFKVALGTTWKENLSELSGGQRSEKKTLLWSQSVTCFVLYNSLSQVSVDD